MPNVTVGNIGELAPGSCKRVDVNGKPVALYNVDGTVYASEDTCPHRGGPLGEGELEGTVVTCPWHGWRFDVVTGQSPVNPNAKIRTLPCALEGDSIVVTI
ncbi:MAG: Rieske 2Fe-2S domain-containing protein [Planctomycetes bacterium]|nr:Rieske 2Fe-2S domain-containing protein [Planctomycetota bacterium]MBI3846518.1 Rieske 2Fe-2S domain-containing protein [Planctomycetota bacterium]